MVAIGVSLAVGRISQATIAPIADGSFYALSRFRVTQEAVVTTDHPTEVNTRSRVNIARCRLGTIGGRTYTAELGLLTKLIYLIGFTRFRVNLNSSKNRRSPPSAATPNTYGPKLMGIFSPHRIVTNALASPVESLGSGRYQPYANLLPHHPLGSARKDGHLIGIIKLIAWLHLQTFDWKPNNHRHCRTYPRTDHVKVKVDIGQSP